MNLNNLIIKYRETRSDEIFEQIYNHPKVQAIKKYIFKRGTYSFSKNDYTTIFHIVLMKAVENFDHEKSSFQTYMSNWVPSIMLKQGLLKSYCFKIPNNAWCDSKKYKKVKCEHPELTHSEITDILDVDDKTSERMRAATEILDRDNHINISCKNFENDASFLVDIPYSTTQLFSAGQLMEEAKYILDDRDYEIINLRFFHGETLESIASTYNITYQRIDQLIKKALKKLRDELS